MSHSRFYVYIYGICQTSLFLLTRRREKKKKVSQSALKSPSINTSWLWSQTTNTTSRKTTQNHHVKTKPSQMSKRDINTNTSRNLYLCNTCCQIHTAKKIQWKNKTKKTLKLTIPYISTVNKSGSVFSNGVTFTAKCVNFFFKLRYSR